MKMHGRFFFSSCFFSLLILYQQDKVSMNDTYNQMNKEMQTISFAIRMRIVPKKFMVFLSCLEHVDVRIAGKFVLL